VTDLDAAERKALFILFLQNQIDQSSFGTASQLNAEYHSQIPEHLLEPAFQKWVSEDFAKANRSGSAPKFRLRRDRFAEAYRRVLELYGASAITVYADRREILSDISPENDFPIKEGWKWLTYESDDEPKPAALYQHRQTMIPSPPTSRFAFGPINWTKSGAIAAWIIIPVTIVGILVAVWLAR
jgi:hypothetical protein